MNIVTIGFSSFMKNRTVNNLLTVRFAKNNYQKTIGTKKITTFAFRNHTDAFYGVRQKITRYENHQPFGK